MGIIIQGVIPTLFSLFFNDFVSSIHLGQESPCNVYLLYIRFKSTVMRKGTKQSNTLGAMFLGLIANLKLPIKMY